MNNTGEKKIVAANTVRLFDTTAIDRWATCIPLVSAALSIAAAITAYKHLDIWCLVFGILGAATMAAGVFVTGRASQKRDYQIAYGINQIDIIDRRGPYGF